MNSNVLIRRKYLKRKFVKVAFKSGGQNTTFIFVL